MMDLLSQIKRKYKKNFFGFKDEIRNGTNVAYIPSYECFIYAYHDGAYNYFKFNPGDIMTVRRVEKTDPYYSVYVHENKCIFSPKELLPTEIVDKEDIKKVVSFYKEYKKKHKLPK